MKQKTYMNPPPKKKVRKALLTLLTMAVLLTFTACEDALDVLDSLDQMYSSSAGAEAETEPPTTETPDTTNSAGSGGSLDGKPLDAPLTVHFLDVGQGDAAFIELPGGKTMLIDSGEKRYGQIVLDYITAAGYSKIDYLVATHPHSDHIAGLPTVIDGLEIGAVYMPKVQHTTKAFENLLLSIEANAEKYRGSGEGAIRSAAAGVVLFDENDLTAQFLSPSRDSYASLNDWSAVLKLTYGETSFLLVGDAEALVERDLLARQESDSTFELSSDVLKAGHHGSRYSNTNAFIETVSPTLTIISCGSENQYGHPHSEAMDILEAAGSLVYRTDIMGNIVVTSDGLNLTVITDK